MPGTAWALTPEMIKRFGTTRTLMIIANLRYLKARSPKFSKQETPRHLLGNCRTAPLTRARSIIGDIGCVAAGSR